MATAQIRINKTPQIQEILDFFQKKYYGLSESEITKVIVSLYYAQEKNAMTQLELMEYSDLSVENKKLYDEVDTIPRSELYNL